MAFGLYTKNECAELIICAFSFQGLQPDAGDPPTLQTDGRTDRRTTCNRKTALCTIVHRAVKQRDEIPVSQMLSVLSIL